MKKIILTISLILFFTGCETKVNGILQQNKQYITLMQYTKRGQIVNSLETVALINATYLNPILKDNNQTKNNEIFIIGVYNSNDFNGYQKGGIHNIHYKLTMNGENWTKAIKANNKILNLPNYPFYNKWMKYYKVSFPKTTDATMKITYSNDTDGNVSLLIKKEIYKP